MTTTTTYRIEVLYLDGAWHEAGKLATYANGAWVYPRFDSASEAAKAIDDTYAVEAEAEAVRIVPVAPTIPVRTVREIRAAMQLNGRMRDDVEAIIRSLRDDFETGSVEVAMQQALDLSTHLCGISADLYDELVEARAYEDHLDDCAEHERVLAEYRLDQRL